jgi:hypothetical protein
VNVEPLQKAVDFLGRKLKGKQPPVGLSPQLVEKQPRPEGDYLLRFDPQRERRNIFNRGLNYWLGARRTGNGLMDFINSPVGSGGKLVNWNYYSGVTSNLAKDLEERAQKLGIKVEIDRSDEHLPMLLSRRWGEPKAKPLPARTAL